MRRMSKVWWALVVGVSLGVTLVGVSPVKADPLTLNPISWSTFLTFADISTTPGIPIFESFNFPPPPPPGGTFPDGEVFSAVYKGIGPADGKFVYVYQIRLFDTEDVAQVDRIAFKTFTTLSPEYPSGTPLGAFYIDSGDVGIGFGLGEVAPSEGDFLTIPKPQIGVDFPVPTGKTSYIFGFIHPLPPTTVTANLIDGEIENLNPLVYTPSPEPASFVLLSAGLLGLAVIRRRRS